MSATPAEATPSPAPTPDGAPPDGSWPGVSVVMPVLDEERHLAEAVAHVLAQGYPGPFELVIAVGPSRDRTAEIAAELAAADPRVVVVDNPSGRTPAALNAAIAASRHPVVVRVDGHGLLSDGYVRTAVQELTATGADNVGGTMAAEGEAPLQHAVALAMTSRLGIGGAKFHVGGDAGPAESVYLGVFRRAALERVGGFDENFRRAQDWEMNYRLRRTGGTVWYSPALRVTYRPRTTWRALGAQFFRTGQWRREVVRRYPETASARYLAAPAATAAIAAGVLCGLAGLLSGARWLQAGLLVPATYAAGITVGSVVVSRGEPLPSRLLLPPVLAVMHLSWGTGFLVGGQSSTPDGAPDLP